MEKKYQDFLQNFWTEDGSYFDLSSNDIEEEIVNDFFETHSSEQIKNFILRNQDGCYEGWVFFQTLHDSIEEKYRENFLFAVWMMFRSYTNFKNDGWHNWRCMFDPLSGEDIKTKYSELFREGFIRFELDEEPDGLGYSYVYGWWKNLEHFLSEIVKYRDQDFVFKFVNSICRHMLPEKNYKIEKNMTKEEMVICLYHFLSKNFDDVDAEFWELAENS